MDIPSDIKHFPSANGTSAPNLLVTDFPKQQAVVAAFKHAWGAHERKAMGSDEFEPHSGVGSRWMEGMVTHPSMLWIRCIS
ncbi:hypothetical protein E1B28_007145 [Marasmius oreades]|uniref:Uncharacterized protein n=1 Tax=Marasmius oreades TaxID=181124 RepID=A0A9P7UVK8_9AGAR|nr:uncharacterized protein E1B28_007145 [Marasmius oreades]KAG7093469.1 hypothetical protein E1B28_007145 [Marasmius oreades]